MATPQELLTLLAVDVDDSVDPATAWALFNAALEDLSPAARVTTKTQISFTVNDLTVALPTLLGILEIREITAALSNGMTVPFAALSPYGVRVVDNTSIDWATKLPFGGSFSVRFTRSLSKIVGPTSVIELPLPFHNALRHYAAKEILQGDDEFQKAKSHILSYENLKAQLDSYTLRQAQGPTSQPRYAVYTPPWAR